MDRTEVFTAEWAGRWCRALNASAAYRAAGARWEGDVALVMSAEPGSAVRAVYLDLHHGECRSARVASEADLASASYVMEAGSATWQELLGGRTPPLMALLSGRLRLTRGSLAALVPFAGAAAELVGTAVAMNSRFPD